MEVLVTQVHHAENLEFHRPLRPGDRLTVKGQVAAILPHRAGTRVVIRFAALDEAHEPVFTEHIGALMRGVKCSDDGLCLNRLPEGPLAEEGVEPLWESRIPIDPLRPHIYDGCTGIVFPIHTSRAFARQVGLPGNILQGTATLAFAVRERPYGHDAVITTVTPDRPRPNTAYERFTDTGPLAMLPMTEGRWSVVWTAREADTQTLLRLSDAAFLARLQDRFGYRLGGLTRLGRHPPGPPPGPPHPAGPG